MMSHQSQTNWVVRIQNRKIYGSDLKKNLFLNTCQNTKSLHLKTVPHSRQRFAFSNDGLFYVSSGSQKNDVVVWPFEEALNTWIKSKPIVLETNHRRIPQSFAADNNCDNSLIYSSSWGSQFFINDTHTYVEFVFSL